MLAPRLSEAPSKFFLVLRKHKSIERVLLPLNVFDAANEEVEPELSLHTPSTQYSAADMLLLLRQRQAFVKLFPIDADAVNTYVVIFHVVFLVHI